MKPIMKHRFLSLFSFFHLPGFLTTESDYARGNYGLLDQLKVLKWVRDNIAKFQGDPKKVTLMGGGSGAASVGMHLVSPMSKGKSKH